MKCTKCGLRDATTEVLRRHNNKIEKMYLCDECAKDYAPDSGFGMDIFDKLMGVSPMGLLGNMGEFFGLPRVNTVTCPKCKTTSDEFLKTGFVGCPHCYEVFEPIVLRTVKQLQQADMHIGKSPFGAPDMGEEMRLKAELKSAIERDDFASASEIAKALQKIGNAGGDI